VNGGRIVHTVDVALKAAPGLQQIRKFDHDTISRERFQIRQRRTDANFYR
jgi:hypothetical protein